MKIKTILIDEERTALNCLKSQLKNYAQNVDVVDTALGIEDGYEKIIFSKPDLIFLDTAFQNGTGFDLLKKFDTINFKVVFTTSNDQYALDAFRVNALDYLLKPVDESDLNVTISKVCHSMEHKGDFDKINQLAKAYFNYSIKNKKLAIKESKSINYIDIEEIAHLKADGNYTNIVLKSGRSLVSSKVLKHYDALLSDYGFLRVHRSNMINLNYVKEFRHRYGGSIVLENDDEISIAPDKKKLFFDRLGMC